MAIICRLCALLLVLAAAGCAGLAPVAKPPPAADPRALLPPALRDKGFLEAAGRTLAPGIEYRRFHFRDLYGAPAAVNLVVVDWDQAGVSAGLHVAGGQPRRTSDQARAAGALVAVNGGYFTIDTTPVLPSHGLKVNGTLLPACKPPSGGVVAFTGVNLPFVGKLSRQILDENENLLCGDSILAAGATRLAKERGSRAPRTAVGVTADRRLLLLAVDGRLPDAPGFTLGELAAFMAELGCRDAVNLDGGGSTTMYIHDSPGNGVVNRPSGDKYGLLRCERPVHDILLLKLPDIPSPAAQAPQQPQF